MPVSKETASKVAKYAKKHGVEKAMSKFGLSHESVKRYMRKAKKKALTVNVDNRPEHLPKVLVFDIETSPILARVWGLWQQNVGLNQIKEDWFVMSYAAKWLGVDGVIYEDLRGVIDDTDKGYRDADLLSGIWNLLNDADMVITQNGKKFDVKKLNARFIINGYQPPSGFKHIDTLQIAKRVFGFTSNKLEYMTDKLCVDFKKLKHGNFPGFELWQQCLADNLDAWKEMEEYNKHDVLSLEELYNKLAAWDDKHPNFSHYSDAEGHVCRCGCKKFTRNGYAYTPASKFQKYRCTECGAEVRGRVSLWDRNERDRRDIRLNIYN
jgi:hypothetical protein